MPDVCFAVSPYEHCDMYVVSVADDEQPEALSEGIASRCRNKNPVSPVLAVCGCRRLAQISYWSTFISWLFLT